MALDRLNADATGSTSVLSDVRMSDAHRRFRDAITHAFGEGIKPAATADVKAGPLNVRIGFASSELANPYLRSLVPATAGPTDPEFMVLTRDDIDLSGLVPDPADRGRSFVDDDYVAMWHADALPVLYLLDRRRRRGLVWLSRNEAPQWELSRPACPLIQASLLEQPWTAVHAGAVGRQGRVLLLAGPGRTGKTTAALACAAVGWDYAGDDYVLVHSRTGRVEPLYTSARLRFDMRDAFMPLLATASRGVSHDGGDSKHELALDGMLGGDRSRGGELAAILLPRRRGALVPEFTPARRADAFHALFLTTTLGGPAPLKVTSEKLSALVGLAPTFFVDTGTMPAAIPDAFAAMMDRL
jgi:hypothetical protein